MMLVSSFSMNKLVNVIEVNIMQIVHVRSMYQIASQVHTVPEVLALSFYVWRGQKANFFKLPENMVVPYVLFIEK